MPWKQHHKKSGGLEAVSSEIGAEIFFNTCLHDDGVRGFGGMRIACVGPMRMGKTTLALETLPKFNYVTRISKELFLRSKERDASQLKKETLVYRGRKLDYWNAYTKSRFSKCFPEAHKRDLRVFIYHKDDITFYEEVDIGDEMVPVPGLDIYRYANQKDLYDHLIEGGINVVYPPNDYFLSQLLKDVLNKMRMLTPEDPEWYEESDEVAVINETFWYDLFYYIQEIENSRENGNGTARRLKSIAFFFDESHQIFPANEPKPFWYLIDDFAENALIDTGRMNMTIYANIHALNLMYWKVLQRFDTFIWLGGSRPDKSYSMVSDKLTRILPKGWMLIEEKQKRFGKMRFPRVPNQPFTVLAKGVI